VSSLHWACIALHCVCGTTPDTPPLSMNSLQSLTRSPHSVEFYILQSLDVKSACVGDDADRATGPTICLSTQLTETVHSRTGILGHETESDSPAIARAHQFLRHIVLVFFPLSLRSLY
jgi:hypothetical protein